jgi:hypothetical protein
LSLLVVDAPPAVVPKVPGVVGVVPRLGFDVVGGVWDVRGKGVLPEPAIGFVVRLPVIPDPLIPLVPLVPYEPPVPAVVPLVRQDPDMLLPPVPRVPIMPCRPYELPALE